MKIVTYKDWTPRNYLREYYSTDKVAEDELLIYKFLLYFLRKHNKIFDEVLEFGLGPTIHHLIPLVPFTRVIYVADYIPKNIREIKKWLLGKKKAHDWLPYIRGVLEIEGKKATKKNILNRVAALKRKIKHLIAEANIFNKNPIGIQKKFPLVLSFYCAECTTYSKKKWKEGMKNLFSLVSPGGWLISSALRNAKYYKSGNHFFPSANINEKDIAKLLYASDFEKKSIRIEVHPVKMWTEEGFNSIIVFKAKKKHSC